jgi:sugar-specific transcriptional regulator TrmB
MESIHMTGRDDAIAALKRLGLSSYEAQVFVALQRIGRGSARDVDRITEVPRSQVYGAAENLEERGLIDVQQSDPIQYRAVDLEEAKSRLRARLDTAEDRAFSYLESARNELGGNDESKEDIWTVQGRETITDRLIRLAREADERVVFGTEDASLLTTDLVEVLADVAGEGIGVTIMSANSTVRERFADIDSVMAPPITPAPEMGPGERSGRVLIVDDETVLLSVLGDEESDGRRETAIWSANTGFASVFVGLFEEWLDEFIDE